MRVLVIDENEFKYKQIKESLERVCSPWITWCKSRNSGLATIIKHNVLKRFQPYDLVITDSVLPLYDEEKILRSDVKDIIDEIRKRGLEELPIVVCSSDDIVDCDFNYHISYNPLIKMDSTFEFILADMKAYQITRKRKDMEVVYPSNKKIDYSDAVGKASLVYRTEIKDTCSAYDPFELCDILECLYCDNSAYAITLESGSGIVKSEKDLYSYPDEHQGLIDHDHEILFYDRVPLAEELYDYLFDEESKYKIIRKSDNEVMVDTTKRRVEKDSVKKLVLKNNV